MRLFGTLAAVVVFTGVAMADIPLGPPFRIPEGKKFVEVKTEVLLGKDVTGYVFVFHEISNPRSDFGDKFTRADLSADKPFFAERTGGREPRLVAIPVAEAKAYKTDDDLFTALRNNKLKGTHTLDAPSRGSVLMDKAATKADSVTWTYTITGIDAKGGVKVKAKGEGYKDPAEKDEPKKPLALAEPGYLIGGIALAVGVTLGGVWLVRRKR